MTKSDSSKRSRARILSVACLGTLGVLLSSVHASPEEIPPLDLSESGKKKRTEAEERLKKEVDNKIPKDQNGKPTLGVAFSIEWTGLPRRGDGYPAEEWVRECGALAENFSRLCKIGNSSKHSSGCLGQLNKELKHVRCVGQADRNAKAGIVRKGDTITFRMSMNQGDIGRYPPEFFLLDELFPTARRAVLGEALVLMGNETYDNDKKQIPMVFDANSFHDAKDRDGDKLGPNTIWETCKRGYSFLTLLASPECEFDMCKGDSKKADAYLKDVKQLKCVWTAKETPPSKEGTTVVYPVGAWLSEPEWGFASFFAVRKQLKIRGCGGNRIGMIGGSKNPGNDPISKECCAKDKKGTCMRPEKTVEMALPACMSDYAYKYQNPTNEPQCVKRMGLGFSKKQLKEAR